MTLCQARASAGAPPQFISFKQAKQAKIKAKGGAAMGALITGGAILGAILGRSFKVLALIPASALALAVLFLWPEPSAQAGLHFSLKFPVAAASLELGYIAGLASTEMSAVMRGLYRLLAGPPKAS
jgi:hypothetical protein